MSSRPKVVPLRPPKDPEATPSAPPAEESTRKDGLLVAVARAVEAGRHGMTWENLAALGSAAYFSWHSEDVDDFGRDARFTETIRPLLEFLYTHASQPEYTYRHRWQVGDLVMWDNRSVQHRGVHDHGAAERRMHRVTIQGDRLS